jgi:hypothetical protein
MRLTAPVGCVILIPFLRIGSTFGLALFWQQAIEGSRVFDIRCFLRKTGIIKKTKTPTMGHFFKEGRDGSLGGYGGTLMSALVDAGTFVNLRLCL